MIDVAAAAILVRLAWRLDTQYILRRRAFFIRPFDNRIKFHKNTISSLHHSVHASVVIKFDISFT